MTPPATAVAVVLSIFYGVLVLNFAVNVPTGDEWPSVIPIVDRSLHGGLTPSLLWGQFYNESHLFIANSLFVLAAHTFSYSIRWIIAWSALAQIAAFVALLVLTRGYLGRPVRWFESLALGVIWFGLAGMENALWGYQIQLYLTCFFLMATFAALLGVQAFDRRSSLFFVAALIAAIAASLSTVQGLLVWPIGAGQFSGPLHLRSEGTG